VRHQDIWRRGTPFFVMPKFLFRGRPLERSVYRAFMNYIGILDDIVDLWEDLANSRYTWCARCFIESNGDSSRTIEMMMPVTMAYEKMLQTEVGSRFPVWNLLIADAKAGMKEALSNFDQERAANWFPRN
jgi:hypothetical protein